MMYIRALHSTLHIPQPNDQTPPGHKRVREIGRYQNLQS